MIDLKIGERVCIAIKNDKVEYAVILWIGTLPEEHVGSNIGTFAGIQFDNPVGKGNGSLGSVQYFQARNGHAAFVPASMLKKVETPDINCYANFNRPLPDPIGTKPGNKNVNIPLSGYKPGGGDANSLVNSNWNGARVEDDLLFESDDDLDEALKVESPELAETTKKVAGLSVGVNISAKKKKGSPSAETESTASSASSGSSPFIVTEEPPHKESSTEWSVVASKIKKAPKQVRDQLKAPEKKAVSPVKTKTKVDKIIDENPKYKSTLCNWYVQGARCPNGANCHYAHGESELRAIPKPKFKYKTQLCSFYALGSCYSGSQCHYAHGLSELQK